MQISCKPKGGGGGDDSPAAPHSTDKGGRNFSPIGATRESSLSALWGVPRGDIRAARSSGKFKEGEDFGYVRLAIVWTRQGRRRLHAFLFDGSEDKAEAGAVLIGCVKRNNFKNHRLVECEVENGGVELVMVRNARALRVGARLELERRGNGWWGRKAARVE